MKNSALLKSWRETSSRFWGLFAHRASAPAARASPNIAITPDKVENNTLKKEGVTLLAAAENYRMTGKIGFQQSPQFHNSTSNFFLCAGSQADLKIS
jgi:hypothetical protein